MNNLTNHINTIESNNLPEDKFIIIRTYNTPSHPDAIRLSSGDIVFSYASSPSSGGYWDMGKGTLFIRTYNPLATEETCSEMVSHFSSGNFYPITTSLSNGNLAVIWRTISYGDYKANDKKLHAEIYNSDCRTIVSDFIVHSSDTSIFPWKPAVTSFNTGGFAVSWAESNSTLESEDDYNVFAKVFDNAGVAQTEEFLVNTNTHLSQKFPTITSLNNDDFVIAWTSNHLSERNENLFAQKFSKSGNRIGSEFQVNTEILATDTFEDAKPTSATLEDDKFIIVWSKDDSVDTLQYNIKAQIFDSSCSMIGTEFQINTTPGGQNTNAKITVNPNNDFTIVWEDDAEEKTLTGVVAQKFNKAGKKQGPEIPVSLDDITDTAKTPAIVSTMDGGFTTAWAEPKKYVIWGMKFPANYTYESSSSEASEMSESSTSLASDSSQGSGGNPDGDGSSISSAPSDYITPGVLLMGLGATIYNAIADFDII